MQQSESPQVNFYNYQSPVTGLSTSEIQAIIKKDLKLIRIYRFFIFLLIAGIAALLFFFYQLIGRNNRSEEKTDNTMLPTVTKTMKIYYNEQFQPITDNVIN